MTLSFPRISITVDDGNDRGTQGELSTLALGFGIHQAWIYTAMFGTTTIFQAPGHQFLENQAASPISLVFLISIIVFGLSLLFAAATDQKFLTIYTAKRMLVVAATLTSVGTFAVFATSLPGFAGMAATVFAGVATGVGSALLLLFWGIAFSRDTAASIVMNTAVAIVIAVAIYSFALHLLPAPFSGILSACLPLLELPLLWKLTPVSYAVRHAIPIFNPLPVKKSGFAIRFAIPVLLFGFALGTLRSVSTQVILPASDLTTQLLALFAGGAATVLLLITTFSIDKRSHWDFLFRPIIPFVAVTLFFLPSLALGDSMLPALVLLTGYMCFEALMWVFFGELSQEFRLSPIFVFGIGRGCLALGSIVGSLSTIDPKFLGSLTPFGEAGGAVLVMFAMVIAYALLPRVRDIKRIVAPNTVGFDAIADFNRRAEKEVWEARGTNASDADEALLGEECATQAAQGNANPQGRTAETVGWSTGSYGNFVKTHGDAHPVAPQQSGMPQEGHLPPGAEFNAERSQKSGRFRAQCETIANRYLLSRRETEVMFLLAKGHNAAYIQDKLCISKSTAKTHISHIYRKLDIHNQQELLGMVDEARDY